VTEPADELDWNRERDGRMADAATTPEDEPQTIPYDPAGDVATSA
jgi:hypothetical protein